MCLGMLCSWLSFFHYCEFPHSQTYLPKTCDLLLMDVHSLIYAVPAIAQLIVDSVNLPVNAASLMDPTPDTITFGIDTALNIPLKTPIKTEPFTLGLFNRETKPITPWLHASFPEYTIKGYKRMVKTNKDADILNEDEFIKTLSNAVHSKKFTLSAKGHTLAYLSGPLKAHLTLDKDIEMDGKVEPSYFIECHEGEYAKFKTQVWMSCEDGQYLRSKCLFHQRKMGQI